MQLACLAPRLSVGNAGSGHDRLTMVPLHAALSGSRRTHCRLAFGSSPARRVDSIRMASRARQAPRLVDIYIGVRIP